jgi:hypothetical protein
LDEPIDFRNLNYIKENWEKYEGNFIENDMHGNGKIFLSNKEYYKGNFSNNIPDGKGIFRS